MDVEEHLTQAQLREYRHKRRIALAGVAVTTGVVTAVVMYLLFYIRLPYYIFGPGAAVDLNGVIAIAGHSPPPGSLFLTDVNVLPGRPAYFAAAKILPGFEIVKRDDLVPPSMSDAQLDSALVDDMKQSQETAEVVAERAAGLHVPSHAAVVVERIVPKTPAATCLRRSDKIVAVDGKPVTSLGAVTDATKVKPAGSAFDFSIVRGAEHVTFLGIALAHQRQRFRRHNHATFGDCYPFSRGFPRDVHHAGFAAVGEVGEILGPARHGSPHPLSE